jgi:hypothetical protein
MVILSQDIEERVSPRALSPFFVTFPINQTQIAKLWDMAYDSTKGISGIEPSGFGMDGQRSVPTMIRRAKSVHNSASQRLTHSITSRNVGQSRIEFENTKLTVWQKHGM